jgi:hypothetical protein
MRTYRKLRHHLKIKNTKQQIDLKEEPSISKEHIDNNLAVRKMLHERE